MGLLIQKSIVLLGMIFCVAQMIGQQELILKKGGITMGLRMPEYPKSSYSIYIPSTFDPSVKWPVLVGFDSSNAPSKLTSLLRASAEELGYVIVVSNFSGKVTINDKASYVSSFLDHIIRRLPIDRKRMYAVGYHKDAVLTSALPLIFEDFDGVIAIEDSFDFFRSKKIRKSFYYAAIVSDQRHTYLGLLRIRKYLLSKAVPAQVFVYDSESVLPNSELITKVISSFQIRDMLNGKMAIDSIWLNKTYEKNLAEVEILLSKNELLQTHNELTRMIHTYKFIRDPKPLKKRLHKISKMREYKKERGRWHKYTNQERWWRSEFAIGLQEDLRRHGFNNLGWWRFSITELEKSLASNKEEEVAMAVRVRSFVQMLLTAAENQLIVHNKDALDQKLLIKVLYTMLNPKDYNSFMEIISLSAKDRDFGTALFYLEEMLKNGFKDIESLSNIEGTLTLRLTKGYNDLLKKYFKELEYQQ